MRFLDCSEKLDALPTLNAMRADRRMEPVRGDRGGWLVGSDLLPDAHAGGYWQDYGAWLLSLADTDEVPAPVSYPSPF